MRSKAIIEAVPAQVETMLLYIDFVRICKRINNIHVRSIDFVCYQAAYSCVVAQLDSRGVSPFGITIHYSQRKFSAGLVTCGSHIQQIERLQVSDAMRPGRLLGISRKAKRLTINEDVQCGSLHVFAKQAQRVINRLKE